MARKPQEKPWSDLKGFLTTVPLPGYMNEKKKVYKNSEMVDTVRPLQLMVTLYKINHATHWDIQIKATSSSQICIFFVLGGAVRSLLSSMVDFVPCDR